MTDNQRITDTDICIFVSIFVQICIHSFCRCYTRFAAYPYYIQIQMFTKQLKNVLKEKEKKNSTDRD
jgi:hypothetical protein